jgi:hypothetical protein
MMIAEWLGIPAAFIAWGFALYVFVVAPPSRGARFLVAMLVVDGLAVITSGHNLYYVNKFLGETFGLPEISQVTHQVSDWALIAVYLPFLGMTLNSPLVAPLKNPLVARAVMTGGLAVAALIPFLPYEVREQFNVPFYIVICIVLAWGFAAAVHSWYIATNDAERDRARAFTIAFGLRDILWTFSFSMWFAFYFGFFGGPPDELSTFDTILGLSYQLAVILYVPLVAYGVLRVQLFDVDLRIKRTIKRSTIAAAFVATFFIVSESAGNYLSSQFGTVLGVLGTAALIFFLDPIQRAAEKLSDAAMPNTHDTPEYEIFRKLQVYESAVRAALEDGHISDRQRRVLTSMIETMGIDAKVAEALENDARAALAG